MAANHFKILNSTKLHIEHLLLERGIIAVPGLGVFVSRRVPASLDGACLSSPAMVAGFDNYLPSPDDSELVSSVSRALSCDGDTARDLIAGDVEAMRKEMIVDGSCTIGSSGTLVADAGGVKFTPADGDNWLKCIDVEPLISKTAPAVAEEDDARREIFLRSLRRTASSAAAIAVFAVMAFIFSHLPGRNATDPQVASFGFEQTVLPVRPIDGSVNPEPSLVLIFNTPDDASSPVDEPVAVVNFPSANTDKYCLVVASLASRADADAYVSAYGQGYRVLEKDGRFRVYTLSGSTFESLNKAAIQGGEYTRHPNAWICRM